MPAQLDPHHAPFKVGAAYMGSHMLVSGCCASYQPRVISSQNNVLYTNIGATQHVPPSTHLTHRWDAYVCGLLRLHQGVVYPRIQNTLQPHCHTHPQMAQYSELHSALFRGLFSHTPHADTCPFLVLKVRGQGGTLLLIYRACAENKRMYGHLHMPI